MKTNEKDTDIKQKYIDIPQGCYAKITPATPQEVIGLATQKVLTCSHIIVVGKDQEEEVRYLSLAHADTLNDLEDVDHGLKCWIREAAQHGQVFVDVGENEETHRNSGHGPIYYNLIKKIINELEHEIPNIKITDHCAGAAEYGLTINRSNGEIKEYLRIRYLI